MLSRAAGMRRPPILKGSFLFVGPAGEQRLDAEQGLLCSGPQAEAEISMLGASGCLVEVRRYLKE